MKTAAILIVFLAGFQLAKLDSKYGAAFGEKLGAKTRQLLNLPPIESKK